jgi:hypothetical protein
MTNRPLNFANQIRKIDTQPPWLANFAIRPLSFENFSNFLWELLKISLRTSQDFFENFSRFLWGLLKFSLRTSQDFFKNFSRFLWELLKISLRTSQVFFENFSRFLWELRKLSLRTSRKEIYQGFLSFLSLFWSVYELGTLNPKTLAI